MFLLIPRTSIAHLCQRTLLPLGAIFIFSMGVLAPGCWFFHEYSVCQDDSDCSSVQVCDDQLCRLRDGVQICGEGYDDCPSGLECDPSLAACVESGGTADVGEDVGSDAGDDVGVADTDQGEDVERDTPADVEDDGAVDTATDVADESESDSADDTTADLDQDVPDTSVPDDTGDDPDIDVAPDITDEQDPVDISEDLQIDIPPSCGDGNVDDGEECDDELDPLDDSCFDTCLDGSTGDQCNSDSHCSSAAAFCGPSGCQAGVEGDSCTTFADCAVSTPICGPSGCQDGSADDTCSIDAHCNSAPFCGPDGCQAGTDGQPCVNADDCSVSASICTPSGCSAGNLNDACVTNAHCSDSAPRCSPGQTCQLGEEGDPCSGSSNCSVADPFCNPDGECQDGSEGDYCLNSSSVCGVSAEICSSDGFCQDGSQGDSCDEPSDCGTSAPLCVLDQCEPEIEGFELLEPGTYTAGSPASELGHSSSVPERSITLSRAFYIQVTEVTQSDWDALIDDNPSYFDCADCPVETVTFWETLVFANELSNSEDLTECYSLTGCTGTVGDGYTCDDVTVTGSGGDPYNCVGYRLPTEAEWEYAYRAGTSSALYNGDLEEESCTLDDNLNEIGWYCGNVDPSETHVSSGKAPNSWGLYDMAGNVYEWVFDWLATVPTSPTTDPVVLEMDLFEFRVMRGGSLLSGATKCRAAHRTGNPPDGASLQIGFRLARTL